MSETTADTRYTVATYSYACTAYVRTTLRGALALQSTHIVWPDERYINAANGMVGLTGWCALLPDKTTWELTRLELMAIHIALEWRKGHRTPNGMDRRAGQTLFEEWDNIADEIYQVLQGIWHSEGKYWM